MKKTLVREGSLKVLKVRDLLVAALRAHVGHSSWALPTHGAIAGVRLTSAMTTVCRWTFARMNE